MTNDLTDNQADCFLDTVGSILKSFRARQQPSLGQRSFGTFSLPNGDPAFHPRLPFSSLHTQSGTQQLVVRPE